MNQPADATLPGPSFSTGAMAPSFDAKRQSVQIVQAIYTAPIEFYGAVKDQFGVPVVQARIDYSIVDKFFEPGSKGAGVSNEQGLFALTGVKGAALTVGVSKTGYTPIYGQSNGSFAFGMPFDAERNRPTPTKNDPAIFILRKKTPGEPLFVIDRDLPLPKDGKPIEVNLRTGKSVPSGSGDLKIECWTSDNTKDAHGHYEWHARLSIPGGGLQLRTQPEREFEAPETGYVAEANIRMPQEASRWERNFDGQYWVLLRDRTFARMRLRLNTAGAHFATISSHLNPSGSRNLEFDDDKAIR